MIDWNNVQRLVVPDGAVVKITCGGIVLWDKSVQQWEFPVQIGDVLYITQVYSAEKTDNTLIIQ